MLSECIFKQVFIDVSHYFGFIKLSFFVLKLFHREKGV